MGHISNGSAADDSLAPVTPGLHNPEGTSSGPSPGAWIARTSPSAGAAWLLGVASSGAGTSITVDSIGNIYRSTDGGVTWSAAVANIGLGIEGFASFTNGVFLISGTGGFIFRSTDDGITWSAPIDTHNASSLSPVSWAVNGANVVALPSNVGDSSISTDTGATWIYHNGIFGVFGVWQAIASLWDGAQYVAIGSTAGEVSTVNTSPDGFTWAQTAIVPSTDIFDNGLAFASGLYVASTATNAVRSAASAAGLASAADTATPLDAGGLSFVVSGNSKFWAFDFIGGSAKSTDAIAWSAVALNFIAADYCRQCSYDATHGNFIAVGGNSGSISTIAG